MASALERLQAQLQTLPKRPGVYIMRDAQDEVIYVGKAAVLRSRVRSYFGSPHSLEPKTRHLVEQIADFEYIVTSSAQEALILEATLVKRHQPFFNVRLKDDKHYPYLKISLNEPWPRVEITRRVQPDGARYFGPYASAGSVRKTLDLVKKLFPWRSCTKVITGTDPRPCLDYFIHRCIAPCAGYCSKEEYDNVIRQVILFLEGRVDEVLRELRLKMDEAAEGLEFERAAVLRDQIQAVERVTERQVMAAAAAIDTDVFGLARKDNQACVQVFFIRGGQRHRSRRLHPGGRGRRARGPGDGQLPEAVLPVGHLRPPARSFSPPARRTRPSSRPGYRSGAGGGPCWRCRNGGRNASWWPPPRRTPARRSR